VDAGPDHYALEQLAREAVERARADAARRRPGMTAVRPRPSAWAGLRAILSAWGARRMMGYRKGIAMGAERVD
jgi:hypothetical protein